MFFIGVQYKYLLLLYCRKLRFISLSFSNINSKSIIKKNIGNFSYELSYKTKIKLKNVLNFLCTHFKMFTNN